MQITSSALQFWKRGLGRKRKRKIRSRHIGEHWATFQDESTLDE